VSESDDISLWMWRVRNKSGEQFFNSRITLDRSRVVRVAAILGATH